MKALILVLMAFDLLAPLIAVVTLVLLVLRRRWSLWRAYALCVGLYLAWAYASTYLIIGGHVPSNYVLVSITFAIDDLIPWHAHGGVQYHGHTEREIDFMVVVYPVVALLIVPTFIFWLVSLLHRRKTST